MLKISVEEAAINLKNLLEQVAKGEEVILLEQDKIVARLVPPQKKRTVFSWYERIPGCTCS